MPLDVAFVRLTLHTKWENSTARLLWDAYPGVPFYVIDGSSGWPNVWFTWLKVAAETNHQVLVLVDEDFFLTNLPSFREWVERFWGSGATLSGLPDAFHPARYCNPLAINPSIMLIRRAAVVRYAGAFDRAIFEYDEREGWRGGLGLTWNGTVPELPFELSPAQAAMQAPAREHEFYYQLYWKLLQDGHGFEYVFPFFDLELKSSNPRLRPYGPDIGYHMFMGRCAESEELFLGVPNAERYKRLVRRLLRVPGECESAVVGL